MRGDGNEDSFCNRRVLCCEGHSLLAITKSHLHFLLLLHPRPHKLAAGHKKGRKGRINSCRRRPDQTTLLLLPVSQLRHPLFFFPLSVPDIPESHFYYYDLFFFFFRLWKRNWTRNAQRVWPERKSRNGISPRTTFYGAHGEQSGR